MERRTADGVDSFLNECTKMGFKVECVRKMTYCDGQWWHHPETKSLEEDDDCEAAVAAANETTTIPSFAGREQHSATIEIYSI